MGALSNSTAQYFLITKATTSSDSSIGIRVARRVCRPMVCRPTVCRSLGFPPHGFATPRFAVAGFPPTILPPHGLPPPRFPAPWFATPRFAAAGFAPRFATPRFATHGLPCRRPEVSTARRFPRQACRPRGLSSTGFATWGHALAGCLATKTFASTRGPAFLARSRGRHLLAAR